MCETPFDTEGKSVFALTMSLLEHWNMKLVKTIPNGKYISEVLKLGSIIQCNKKVFW